MLEELDFKPDVTAIREAKLNSNNRNLVNISNYDFVHCDSELHAGGVGLYIRHDLKYDVGLDLSLDLTDSESLFVSSKK